MSISLLYQSIAYYETKAQKHIIEYLVDKKYINNQDLLIIDATNYQLKINGISYPINFNKFNKLVASLLALRNLNQLNLQTNVLVGPIFTGINSLFLSSYLSAKSTILIDDGIGTPVNLIDDRVFDGKLRYKIRYFIIQLALKLLYNIKLSSISTAKQKISSYYTVYNLGIQFKPETFKINYYNYSYKINNNQKAILGTPFIEFKLVPPKQYIDFLREIVKLEGPSYYYLHPDEHHLSKFKIPGVTIVRANEAIEEYFKFAGVPNTIISFCSSAMLNLASNDIIGKNVKLYYIKKKVYGPNIDQMYYNILDRCNCIPYKLSL